jgi:hypothetical protein
MYQERKTCAPRFIADERGESPEHGVYAKLNATKTEILNVYLDKKTACFDNGYTSSSGIDIAEQDAHPFLPRPVPQSAP